LSLTEEIDFDVDTNKIGYCVIEHCGVECQGARAQVLVTDK
jgi:hypothetical protein